LSNKTKALKLLNKGGGTRGYKIIVLDFEEWLNNTEAMNELKKMSAKEVVGVVREVWEECKSIE